MKLKHKILSCISLLAVVWGIIFSGTIFFQQQQDVNLKKLGNLSLTKKHNNSIHNNLLLTNLLSNKTEENSELTEYEKEANEANSLCVILTNFHANFRLFNLYFSHSITEIRLIPKCSLIVKYCSLKLPF